jgi:NAD(P)H-quinone oxidoreductase subunit 5
MNRSIIYVDNISIIMMALILIVGASVMLFSRNYMFGDAKKKNYFYNLIMLITAVLAISISNHILLMLLSLGCANIFLVRLMIHKSSWRAALNSGKLAFKYLACGFIMIASGLLLLAYIYDDLYIHNITQQIIKNSYLEQFAMILIMIGILVQSGIFPFHKWLLSSLNSPTPVSAIMHAGLINSGAFLLARLSPLYLQYDILLDVIFIAGFISAIIGTIWKLMQPDIKRMLACSTMGQMGFMIMQCGLGIFTAALAHMCFHGFFKAYLFLSSGENYKEKRLTVNYPPTLLTVILSIICGIFGMVSFLMVTNLDIRIVNSDYVLLLVILISGSQLGIAILKQISFRKIMVALLISIISGLFYGACLRFFENLLQGYNLFNPVKINMIHIICSLLLILSWGVMIISNFLEIYYDKYIFIRKAYVWMLNKNQADKSTITAHKKEYNYL